MGEKPNDQDEARGVGSPMGGTADRGVDETAAGSRESPTRASAGRETATGQASGRREAGSGMPTGRVAGDLDADGPSDERKAGHDASMASIGNIRRETATGDTDTDTDEDGTPDSTRATTVKSSKSNTSDRVGDPGGGGGGETRIRATEAIESPGPAQPGPGPAQPGGPGPATGGGP